MSSIENKKNNLDVTSHTRVFVKLKDHGLVQKILINTLLIKRNCVIEDLASLLHIDVNKLRKVLVDKCTLKGKKSLQLVTLFYMLN